MTKASVLSAIMFLATCSGGSDYGWKLDDSYGEVLSRFHAAVALADRAVMEPACRSKLSELPSWPIGPVSIRWVHGWPDGDGRLLARTMWRNEGRFRAIPPRIEVHERVFKDGSTRFAAIVLLHELVHAASWTSFQGLDPDELPKAIEENERLAQEISVSCINALEASEGGIDVEDR